MEERGRSRKRGKKLSPGLVKARKRKRKRGRSTVLAMIILLAAGYLAVSLKYRTVFLPNTTIGSIAAAGMTADEVKERIRQGIDGYQLILEERGGREEMILGRDIDLQPVYDGSLEQILQEQNSLLWGIRLLKSQVYEQNCMVKYNEEKLDALISSLECLKPENITEPADAYLSYQEENGLIIVPAEQGNAPIPERLSQEIKKVVYSLKERVSLEELGVYREPEILKDNQTLLAQKERWEGYANAKVTYRFGSRVEVVDGSVICGWLTEDGNGNAAVDRTKAEAYVKGLADKYNTAYHAKELKTTYGPTVKITQGHYGWMIDQKTEVNELIRLIESGERVEREPAYLQTAASHDGPDYGDTYVEMNLTAQHLFYYKDGTLLIESDFVSGNEAKGWSTPAGAYELTYKQKNATLKGKNYKTPVTYWMPFNGNIGMHDGYWRSSFGGTIYKKNGSHGCVNLPPAVAKTIFANIEKDTPVLCYHLEGTQTNKTTKDSSGKAGTSSGNENGAAATQPGIVAPAEKTPETAAAEPAPTGTGTAPVETAPAEPASVETIPASTPVPAGSQETGTPPQNEASQPQVTEPVTAPQDGGVPIISPIPLP